MLEWIRQGAAVLAPIQLTTGQHAKVVVVGGRENQKGAVLVLMNDGIPATETRPLENYIDTVPPAALAEILCMQERLFGQAGLPAPLFK